MVSEGWDESVPAQGSDRDVFYRFMDDVFDEFDGLPGRYDIADAILARWRLVPVEQEPVRSWYRSLLTGGSVWCETSDPTDSYLLSDDKPVVMQRLDTYESSSGWQPWEPETPIQPLERD